jgi:hypothetical protein
MVHEPRNRKYKEFLSSELPDYLIENISNALRNYSTALIRLFTKDGKRAEQELMGSGTFVTIGNVSGILTAHHVAQKFSPDNQLGLALIEREHYVSIPWQYIRNIEVAIPINDEYGPDLSFLALPGRYLENIKTYKSFYPLNPPQDSTQINPGKQDLWFIYGTIGEWTTEELSSTGFMDVKGYQGFGGMTFLENVYQKGTYDYMEIKASFGSENTPRSFGGMSGGGLWRTPILINDAGIFSAKDYFLVGMIFYQTELKDGARYLRCHGPNSLYQVVCKEVENQTK